MKSASLSLFVLLSLSTPLRAAEQPHEARVNRKNIFQDGIYAPLFSEFRLLGSPVTTSSHNYSTVGARCGLQALRLDHLAATVGFSGQTTVSSSLLQFWGPELDVIAFPNSRFHVGASAMIGKGRAQVFNPASNSIDGSDSEPLPIADRAGIKVTAATVYGVLGVLGEFEVAGGLSRAVFSSDGSPASLRSELVGEEAQVTYTIGFRTWNLWLG